MPDEYTISSMTLSSGITNNDLMELATPDQSSETGYSSVSATVVMLATKMLKNIQFASDLDTTDKTIIGAINEILAGGGGGSASILYGTSAPTSSQGENGNLYVQYTAGTGGADDTVDALFVKLDDAWCEISTGGGGGASSADEVSFDDTDVAFEADDVQEAFENIIKYLTWSEYQQLSSAEKNNGTAYFITDVNGDGQTFQPICYSETEREIGVWIDGKPVYEKTLKITPVALSNGSTIPHGISNLGIVVSSDMVMHRSNGEFVLPYTSNYNKTSNFIITSTDLTFVSSDTWGSSDYINLYVTLRYTKSTDTAGSGTWTPQGVPAIHYSTDEQVVGTWIDGSTLYEKTYSVSSSVTIGTSWSDTGFELPTNTNRIIEGFMYRNAQSGALMYSAFSINTNNNHLNAMLAIADTLDAGSSITIRYTKSSS